MNTSVSSVNNENSVNGKPPLFISLTVSTQCLKDNQTSQKQTKGVFNRDFKYPITSSLIFVSKYKILNQLTKQLMLSDLITLNSFLHVTLGKLDQYFKRIHCVIHLKSKNRLLREVLKVVM